MRSDLPTPCVPWEGARSSLGYGYTWHEGRVIPAHRVAYETQHGAIPEGYVVHHRCRVRECVNPDHLEAVTQRENILRGESASAHNAAKTRCPRGHAYTPANLYYAKNGARICRTCRLERSHRDHAARRRQLQRD